jgi:hypothetical protein
MFALKFHNNTAILIPTQFCRAFPYTLAHLSNYTANWCNPLYVSETNIEFKAFIEF